MKETFYFSHDYNSRNDPKLQEVIRQCKLEGLAIFWCLVEMMYEQGGKLMISLCDSYAFALHTEANILRKVVDISFEKDEKCFWCGRVLENLQTREAKREAKVKAGRLGGLSSGLVRRSKAKQCFNQNEANEAKESKVKESKVNKIQFLNFVFLTENEYQKLCEKISKEKTDEMIQKLNSYIGSKGKKYKSHYFTILMWIDKNKENKNNIETDKDFIFPDDN